MANDVDVKQIDSLLLFAKDLSYFSSTISNDCISVAKLILQELTELKKTQSRAKEIYQRIYYEYMSAKNYYAYNNAYSRNLGEMQNEVNRQENRLLAAKRCISEINTKVAVCVGQVQAIISETNKFKKDAEHILEQGHIFIRRAADDLIQYKENSHKI